MRRLSILMNAPTFNNTNGAVDRSAGFSDSWYQQGSDTFDLTSTDTDLINKRAALLPRTSTVVGARVSDVDIYGKTTGKTRTYRMSIAGGQNLECDDPRVSLIYDVDGAGVANEFALFIQNVPDIRVVKGTYNPASSWLTPLRAYLNALSAGGYGFIGTNMANPKIGIRTIQPIAGGFTAKITTDSDPAGLAGFYVKINRTSAWSKYKPNPNGYRCTAAVDVSNCIIDGWCRVDENGVLVALPASKGGVVTKWGKNFMSPVFREYTIQNPAAGSRKVGRPYFQYRGKASTHRI